MLNKTRIFKIFGSIVFSISFLMSTALAFGNPVFTTHGNMYGTSIVEIRGTDDVLIADTTWNDFLPLGLTPDGMGIIVPVKVLGFLRDETALSSHPEALSVYNWLVNRMGSFGYIPTDYIPDGPTSSLHIIFTVSCGMLDGQGNCNKICEGGTLPDCNGCECKKYDIEILPA